MELVKNPDDYERVVNNLLEIMPSIYAVAIIEENNEIVYSTDNWDISTDVENVCLCWDYMNAPIIYVSGVKYTILECEIDSMVATSIQGQGHIVGCKDNERSIIMAYEHIEVSIENGLGTITLNRPPVNVLNIPMMEEMNQALDGLQGKKDLKAVLFNAKGKCFSAGVDVGDHMGDSVHKMVEDFHGMFRRMDRLGVLTVASVYGSCLGGGCELAIFCDLVIADESAKLGQPEIQVGVFPPIAAQIMPRIIGRKAAMDLILSGRIISAQEALQMGLISKIFPSKDFEASCLKEVNDLCKLNPAVVTTTKMLLNFSEDKLNEYIDTESSLLN